MPRRLQAGFSGREPEPLVVLRKALDALLAEARELRERLELLMATQQHALGDFQLAGPRVRSLNLRRANRVF